MPKLPRDLPGRVLARQLERYAYRITSQTDRHIRLTTAITGPDLHITIPEHSPLKIGTLNAMLKDISDHLKMDKDKLVKDLFRPG